MPVSSKGKWHFSERHGYTTQRKSHKRWHPRGFHLHPEIWAVFPEPWKSSRHLRKPENSFQPRLRPGHSLTFLHGRANSALERNTTQLSVDFELWLMLRINFENLTCWRVTQSVPCSLRLVNLVKEGMKSVKTLTGEAQARTLLCLPVQAPTGRVPSEHVCTFGEIHAFAYCKCAV